MNKSIVMILVGAGMALSLPSWGHSDDYLDTLATPHGGQLRMAGPYHLELVTKDKELKHPWAINPSFNNSYLSGL